MRDSEKTGGAKVALYHTRTERAQEIEESIMGAKDVNAPLTDESFVIAVGEDYECGAKYLRYLSRNRETESGTTTDPLNARQFDTYADALKSMLETCAIEEIEPPIPHGWERPRFPRVCYLRLYAEVSQI